MLEGKLLFERRRETNGAGNSAGRSREKCETEREGGGGLSSAAYLVNVSVFVLSRRRVSLNTSPVEWMSVSVSRLEAGRPSCDSMWLPGASRSWLAAEESWWRGGSGS